MTDDRPSPYHPIFEDRLLERLERPAPLDLGIEREDTPHARNHVELFPETRLAMGGTP